MIAPQDPSFTHNSNQVRQSLFDRIETDFDRLVKLEARAIALGMTRDCRDDVEKYQKKHHDEWKRADDFDNQLIAARTELDSGSPDLDKLRTILAPAEESALDSPAEAV